MSMQGIELAILKSLISSSRSIKEADQNTIKEPDKGGERGLVVRALHLQAGGPGFKSSSLPLDGFVFGGPEFNSCTLCK